MIAEDLPVTDQINELSGSPLLVIVGETASGKSALAMELAEKFNGEIICADSRTAYKGMDIGTAKPSRADQTKIKHYGLDVVEPGQSFNVADFKSLADQAITDITARGKLPILVGGSGLYIDAVIYDYQFMPSVDSAERERLTSMTVEELQAEIKSKGLQMPNNLRNPRHLSRTIETSGQVPARHELRASTKIIGLTTPIDLLKERIKSRVESMFSHGLEQEVRQLANHNNWSVEAMKGVGYREFEDYFAGDQSLQQTKDRIILATIGLAKKQRTWFKRNSSIQWLTDPSQAVDIVTTLLNKSR